MLPLIKTEFSIGRSIIQCGRISDSVPNTPEQPDCLYDIVKNNEWKKVFLVEDDLAGFVPSYLELQKAGAQMCYGWRVTVVDDATREEVRPGGKVVIFVKSAEGWKTLVKMATLAQVDYFFQGARLDWATIHKLWSDQLVMAIPFYDSFLHRSCVNSSPCFPDFKGLNPYFFVEDNDVIFDSLLSRKVREYAETFNYPIIETKSCYYGKREDLIFFQARKLMNRKSFKGGNIEEPNMEFFASAEFCIEAALEKPWGGGEFEAHFDQPLELFLPGIRLPEFKLSEDDRVAYQIPDGAKDIEVLAILAEHGFKDRLAKGELDINRQDEYRARIERELEVLAQTDFDAYILLVWDVLRFVRKNGLAYGAGRGSAAGSLVNYLVGITDIDPLPADLYFERFISLSRAKTNIVDGVKYIQNAPDIDVDLGAEARERVIEYLSEKYKGRFVKLSTFNTQMTKVLVKDAGKILGGFSEEEIKVISDEVPVRFGKVAKPESAYEESEKFKAFADANPLIYRCVRKLQGCIKNMGSHASAYLISYDPLNEFMPLQYGTDKEVVTSCDADVSERMVIKLDLLGLQSVTLLDNVVKRVGIDPAKIDYDDYDTIYSHLQNLECPSNLFQISGNAAVRGLNKIKPRNMSMLSDVLAICRPGSFAFIDQYADFMNGVGEKPSIHPIFDAILEKSGGVMLYQESLMQMFNAIGFSLAEADDIRRLVSKKKAAEMLEWEPKIYAKALQNGVDEKAAKSLWLLALASADYSFNRSHSFAYSRTTALSVYCKFKYPTEFFVEALKLTLEKQDPTNEIAEVVRELPDFGIKLLPPSLAKANHDFVIEGGDIRFGLGAIKGISEKALRKIQQWIGQETTTLFSVFQAALQSKIPSQVLHALIEVGCLDDLAPNSDRQLLVLYAKYWKELSEREQQYCLASGGKYGFDLRVMMKDYMSWVGTNGKPMGRESRLATLRRNCLPHRKIYEENVKTWQISQFLFEKKLLGYCPSFTLTQLFDDDLEKIKAAKFDLAPKSRFKMVGEIKEVRTGVAKASGNKYAKITLADETGAIDILCTGDRWANYLEHHETPEEGQILLVKGTKGPSVEEPIVFVDNMSIQEYRIFVRLSDLKKLEGKGVKEEVKEESK